jgi:hypothetical protein
MARGIVKGNPRAFTRMLWDSSRKMAEYNTYGLGRKHILVLNDKLSDVRLQGPKVIKSKSKILYTSLSVFLTALMLTKALMDGPGDGYIIFSRSLDIRRA